MSSSLLLTPRQAAKKLGISYRAIKRRIYLGAIRSSKTPGGHYRVSVEALEDFLYIPANLQSLRISGTNQLAGTVVAVAIEGLVAKVTLVVGDQRVTAIITADAVKDLDLKPGDAALALIEATGVMVARW